MNKSPLLNSLTERQIITDDDIAKMRDFSSRTRLFHDLLLRYAHMTLAHAAHVKQVAFMKDPSTENFEAMAAAVEREALARFTAQKISEVVGGAYSAFLGGSYYPWAQGVIMRVAGALEVRFGEVIKQEKARSKELYGDHCTAVPVKQKADAILNQLHAQCKHLEVMKTQPQIYEGVSSLVSTLRNIGIDFPELTAASDVDAPGIAEMLAHGSQHPEDVPGAGRAMSLEHDQALQVEMERVSVEMSAEEKAEEKRLAEELAWAESEQKKAETEAERRKTAAARERFVSQVGHLDDKALTKLAKDSNAVFPEGASRAVVMDALVLAVGIGAPDPPPKAASES